MLAVPEFGPEEMIETEQLRLRPLREEDVPAVFRLSQEDGMRRWIPNQVYANEQEAGRVVRSLMALPRVLGIVDSDNRGSCRVLVKCGFTLVTEETREAFGRICRCSVYQKSRPGPAAATIEPSGSRELARSARAGNQPLKGTPM